MTDLPLSEFPVSALPFEARRASAPRLARRVDRVLLLYAATAGAAALGLTLAARGAAPEGIERPLVLLLRFMAVVKAAMALGALALTHWRVRRPISPAIASGYVGAIAAMLVATGVIWSLRHVGFGAVLFHVGLFAFLGLAWKDDAAGHLLAARQRR